MDFGRDGSCNNRVIFVQDPELGRGGSDTQDSEELLRNSSGEFSIVGPLPGASRQGLNNSSSSFNFSSTNVVLNDDSEAIQGTSILKKQSSYRGRSIETETVSTSGKNSVFSSGLTFKSRSTQSTGGSSGSSGYYAPHSKSTPRPVWYGRWLFFTLLCLIAVALGYLTYSSLSDNETLLADCVFVKVAENAIVTISNNQLKKKLGMNTLASTIGSTGNDQSKWPYVAQNDYESIAKNVIDVSRGCNIAYGPIVTPVQVPSFESFAADWYQNSRVPEPFPSGTGVKVNDEVGIWAMDEGGPFHDVSGATAWNSSHQILVPMLQHVNGPSPKLMFNLHSSPLLGKAMEDMMTCAEEKKKLIIEHERKYSNLPEPEDGKEVEQPPPPPSLEDCTMVTDIAHNKTSWVQGADTGPGASMLQPIFPAKNRTEMVGVLVTSIVWAENLKDVFSANVNGVDLVISTPTQSVSYRILNGVAKYMGIGDFHDSKYDDMKEEGDITLPGLFADQSVHYTVSLYPSIDVYDMYSTNNPVNATVGAICVMFFTVLMFAAYDFLVRREFSAKAELLKAKRHFMRYVSHEVRTPLNSVCMGLNLMQEEIQSKLSTTRAGNDKTASITVEEANAWLSLSRDIHISAQSATNVLNDFLNYDKIESRKLTLELSVVPIDALIREISREFILPAQEKAIQLSVVNEKTNAATIEPAKSNGILKSTPKPEVGHGDEVQSQLFEDQVVVGDRARLSQVIRNVISNAIKFTPQKGRITVKATWLLATVGESTSVNLQDGQTEDLHQTGWIQLEVTDTGPGMTEDQLATVFESGVQFNVNKHQKGGGSGLGLYIAKGIVDQHNGTLMVHSDGLDQGTTFNCKLPLFCKPKVETSRMVNIPFADDSIRELVPSTWLDDPTHRDFSFSILVVDDAPMNRKLLARLLTKRGHVCDIAEDGLEALEKVKSQMKEGKRYDTILMDFQMPVMDGPTSAQHIRMEGCDSFIVGITGNVLPQDVEHFKACGADGVLGKPFQIEELENMWVEYGVTAG